MAHVRMQEDRPREMDILELTISSERISPESCTSQKGSLEVNSRKSRPSKVGAA
jgi:hypothetical protein